MMLVYFMDMRSILLTFDIFYGNLVYFELIWPLFPVFVYFSKKNLATLHSSERLSFCLFLE
jgi:hypothetical protein